MEDTQFISFSYLFIGDGHIASVLKKMVGSIPSYGGEELFRSRNDSTLLNSIHGGNPELYKVQRRWEKL